MKKSLLLAAALGVLLPTLACAHLVIHADLFAPGGTKFTLYTADSTRDGYMPNGGGQQFLDYTVLGYYNHTGRVDVWASFTPSGGATVNCSSTTAGVYEPQWHYKTTCRHTFRFDGVSCQSSCEAVPYTAPDGSKAIAFPNPMRSTDDAIQFANLPPNAAVKIYSPSGHLVFEKTAGPDGALHWHTDDLSGRMVGTGVYHVVAKGENQVVTLEAAIQR